jgi:SAM-dependent methyltransferase
VSDSIRFDRAAEFYDRTRSISDEAMARTVETVGAELRGRGRVLEVGVGTGLLALPLREAGIDVVGVDISAPMLGKLLEKSGGTPALPVAHADATRMPFVEGGFGAAYLRWVLHLIPDWRGVLDEVVRVVRGGGVFLANLGNYGGARREIQLRFGELAGVSTEPAGLTWSGFDELDAEMARHGAMLRVLPAIDEGGGGTLEEFLEGIDENRYSWTWPVAEDVRRRTAAQLRAWTIARFGPLDEPRDDEHATVWRVYDLP